MRSLLAALILVATPALAETPTLGPLSVPAPAVWQPAADYITAGQDEPGYRSWYLAAPWHAAQVKQFNEYLMTYHVGGVVPTWQLLRTATSWEKCGGQPFEVPPTSEWPHIVQTLRYVHDYVIPAVGPVEPVSGYRNPALNQCSGGAPESAHKHYSAIDLVPLRPTTREALMKTLCDIHSEHGAPYNAGLGFYAFLRFHVDSTKFRRWNMDPAVASQCPPILQPVDIATVGQPAPDQAVTTTAHQAGETEPAATPAVAAAPTTPPPPSPERGRPQH